MLAHTNADTLMHTHIYIITDTDTETPTLAGMNTQHIHACT